MINSLPTLSSLSYPIENIEPIPCRVTRSVRGFPYTCRATMRIARRSRDGILIWKTDASGIPNGGRRLLSVGVRSGTKKEMELYGDIPYSLHNCPVA